MELKIYKITDSELTDEEKYIGVEKVAPIYPSEISVQDYFRKMNLFLSEYGEVITPREVCVSLVHLKIWQKTVAQKTNSLIFESDININISKLNDFQELNYHCWDFIHCGIHPDVKKNIYFKRKIWCLSSEEKKSKVQEVSLNPLFYGAFAYYINQAAAHHLVYSQERLFKRSDNWRRHFIGSALRVGHYGLFPHPAERHELGEERGSVVKLNILVLLGFLWTNFKAKANQLYSRFIGRSTNYKD